MRTGYNWLRGHKLKAFYNIVDGMNFETGATALLQASGIGKLRPNVLMMGYKSDWRTCSNEQLTAYFNILQYAMP